MTEDLRRRALDALGRATDPHVREAIRVGHLTIERRITSWEGTAGTHDGHRVTVGLPAGLLGAVRERPALRQEMETAIARAVAETPHESMVELRLIWSRTTTVTSAYRGPVGPEGVSFGRALFDFLWGVGEESLAEKLGTDSTLVTGDGVHQVAVGCSLTPERRARLASLLPVLLEAYEGGQPQRLSIHSPLAPGDGPKSAGTIEI